MSLFIGKGICYGLAVEELFIKNEKTHRQILTIPRFVKPYSYRDVKFSFGPEFDIEPGDLEQLDKYIYLENARLIKKGQDSYQIKKSNTTEERCMYAILREYTCVSHDLFIVSSQKKNVEVLDCISFYTVEPDYGEYEVKVYIVKITLKDDETLLVYSGDNSYPFEQHIGFYKQYRGWSNKGRYAVKPNLRTLLSPGSNYICLKDLIN